MNNSSLYTTAIMVVGHLDADCFYVSAERVRRPSLLHLPVGVLGNQGACVIAKSYEMKAFGVQTGQPIWEAAKLCPNGVYIKRNFQWYEVLSRMMLEAVRRFSPTVEYYSIDEFFFDADGVDPHEVQQYILKTVGVPVTIGISRSRTLAKLTSDAGKPFGCCVLLDDQEIADYLETMPVQEVTGIAGRSAVRLARYGIRTCGDFRRSSPKLINRLLTKKGEALYWELHGQSVVRISTSRPRHKAIGRGGAIGQATDDRTIQFSWIVRNIERLIEAMVWHRYVASRLSLSVQYRHGCFVKSTSLPEPSSAFEVLLPAARFLFESLPHGTVTHIDLLADRIELAGLRQRSFLAGPARLDAIKRSVNSRIGRFAVRSGETLPLTEIYSDDAHDHEICDVFGKTCF